MWMTNVKWIIKNDYPADYQVIHYPFYTIHLIFTDSL